MTSLRPQYLVSSTRAFRVACVVALLVGACGSKVTSPDGSKDSAGAGGDFSGTTAATGGMTGASEGGRANGTTGGTSRAGAASVSVCNSGDTRTCVGPGACRGGQTCGADEQWGACDCGDGMSSSGGSGGLELEGGAGGTGGDELPIGGTSAGGAVGAGGTSGAGGGGLGPLDEPCPTDAIGVDCSGQCAARAPICDSACPSVVTIPPLKDGLIVGRLPSHPKASCTCDDSKSPFIGAQPAVYALTFQNGSIPKESFHLSVPPPWKITSGFTTGCASSVAQVKCINNLTWFTVWTSDPDAPAVNLVAEAGDRCP